MKQGLPKITYLATATKSSTSKVATCPSCGHHGLFSFVGNQHVPLKLAQSKGMKTIVHLWTCEHCNSTISEPRLLE